MQSYTNSYSPASAWFLHAQFMWQRETGSQIPQPVRLWWIKKRSNQTMWSSLNRALEVPFTTALFFLLWPHRFHGWQKCNHIHFWPSTKWVTFSRCYCFECGQNKPISADGRVGFSLECNQQQLIKKQPCADPVILAEKGKTPSSHRYSNT